VIVDLERFIVQERPVWARLDAMLEAMARDPWRRLPIEEAMELDRLYQRAASDLARMATFCAEPETRRYLEGLVARGYAEIHGAAGTRRLRPAHWLMRTFPAAWRRHVGAFWLAAALMAAGAAFGGAAIAFDPDSKPVLVGYQYLQMSPTDRVRKEEESQGKALRDRKAGFSGALIVHNTQVTFLSMALGMTWGVGTTALMVLNGVILGAVAVDYVLAGQAGFVFGWLLPHGAVEIPAMLLGGQAGFVIAGSLLGRDQRKRMAARLRAALPDVVTLSFGAALLLVWAGVVEAFFSQYHEPVIPYAVKIAFGAVELAALSAYLAISGRAQEKEDAR
jgi:uncharacterized membrane protein SpoIIM required for sporulation